MEEEQVHAVPIVPDPQPLLTRHEGEIVTKLEQEVFQALDQSLLQLVLRILIF